MATGGKRKTDPGYGCGEVTLAFDDDVLLDEQELTHRLLEVFNAPDYRPPTLPSVAMELLSLSQQPEVRFEDIVALLEQDTMLTGKVLKLLQSPIYAGTGKGVASLKNAVIRVGLNTLRDIVLETSLNMRVFRADAFTDTMERLRRHSVFTAHLCKTVCKYTTIEGEYAFLCGLLHDVGIAGTLIALAEKSGKKRPDMVAIWPAIDGVHQEAGALMAKVWQLPMEIQMVIGAHHAVMIEGYAHPLAATVCLAEAIAHELGVGLVPKEGEDVKDTDALESACLQSHTSVDRSSPKGLEHARQALQLSDQQAGLIHDEAEQLKEQLGEA
jgi:putative nucleotidyltransferase with HDIG domain